VRRWMRVKGEGWRRSLIINAVGAITTGVVLVIVTFTKFGHLPKPGAWIVIGAMPVIVAFFLAVHRHYESVSRILRARRITVQQRSSTSFVVLVPDLGPATMQAVTYLRGIRPEHVTPLYLGPRHQFEET